MTVLAIDPGFGRLGWAVLKKDNGQDILLGSDCVTTSNQTDFPTRLQTIAINLKTVLQLFPNITDVAVEKLYFAKNKTTALKVAEVRGVVLELAATEGFKVSEYSPAEVKAAVAGHGGATKSQVANMVGRLIKLEDRPRLDDELDAIAIGLTHLAVSRF